MLAVIYGLKRVAEDGPGWLPALAVLAGLVLGVVFLRRQRTLADPLIDLRLFRMPAFGASLATYTLATFVVFGVFVFSAQYLQLVAGLSPLQAGLWTVPWPLSFVVGSMLTPVLVRRIRPDLVIAAGLGVAAVGLALVTQIDADSGLAVLVAGSVVYSLGLAPVFTLATDVIVGAAPPERAGSAAAISETGSELGGALGIAILGSIGTAVYRGRMADALPAAMPPEAAEAARTTLGGALAAAERLPDQLGAELVLATRAAFAQSLELIAGISAFMTMVMAVLALIRLRRERVDAAPARETGLEPGGTVADSLGVEESGP